MTAQLLEAKTIFVVGGPAGSGKTTVATYLSQELTIPYLEGDDVCLRPVLFTWSVQNSYTNMVSSITPRRTN